VRNVVSHLKMGCIFWILSFDFIVIHHSFVLSLQQGVGVMDHGVAKEGTLPLVIK